MEKQEFLFVDENISTVWSSIKFAAMKQNQANYFAKEAS